MCSELFIHSFFKRYPEVRSQYFGFVLGLSEVIIKILYEAQILSSVILFHLSKTVKNFQQIHKVTISLNHLMSMSFRSNIALANIRVLGITLSTLKDLIVSGFTKKRSLIELPWTGEDGEPPNFRFSKIVGIWCLSEFQLLVNYFPKHDLPIKNCP